MSEAQPATRRFDGLAEEYDRYRPRYPPEAIDYMLSACGAGEGTIVADIGAGTGISALPLLERGLTVYAVEPSPSMCSVLRERLGRYPNLHCQPGDASNTGLADAAVSLVLAAQAFHWFDRPAAQVEFRRILRPGGMVALLFNERLTNASEFLQAFEDCLLRHAIDYTQVNHANLQPEVFDSFFSSYEQRDFPNAQFVDLDGLLGRVRSMSYMPHPGDSGWGALEKDLRHHFVTHARQGGVEIMYQTQVYCGSLPDN